jgi:hypothetical protein
VTTWLTHAMLIGSSGLPESAPNRRGTFYIPLLIYGESAGGGGTMASDTAPGPTSKAHAGVVGRSGRAGRRGLIAPREVKRVPDKKPWSDPFQVGFASSADPRGALGHDSGSGDGRGGGGHGSGDVGHGTGGGAGPGGAGQGALAATVVKAPLPAKEEDKKKMNRGEARSRDNGAREISAAEELDLSEIAELEVALQNGRQVKAAYISQDTAAYYRMDDAAFPRLDAYWLPGRREYTMLFRICVSVEGTVSKVVVLKSASEEVDQVLCSAIHSWRYRPRIVEGTPQPFCHPIRITYTR